MKENISEPFYSNCIIQAIKHKIMDWRNVEITYIPPKYGESYWYVPHLLWSDGKYDYDFGVERHLNYLQVFLFKGCIRRRNLGWNKKYKQRRIAYYNKIHEHTTSK